MTVLTMRRVRDHFIVSGPDIEPMKFKSRPEARDWCKTHHPGSGSDFKSRDPGFDDNDWICRAGRVGRLGPTSLLINKPMGHPLRGSPLVHFV